MYLFSCHLSFLSYCIACLLLVCSQSVQAASGTVEVDLVFPQNDTYAPAPIVPIAFAFQNSELAGYLHPDITFRLYRYSSVNRTYFTSGHYSLKWTNWTSTDPYIQYGVIVETLNTEGTWMMDWIFRFFNCSSSGDPNPISNSARSRIMFTTKKGAKAPDIIAATGGNVCSGMLNHTFEITDTRDSGDVFENRKPCAVLAETTPIPTPCAGKTEASAASSVSSSLTNIICATKTLEPASWCPEPKKPEDGGARGLMVPSLAVGGTVFLAVVISSLAFFLM